MSDEYFDEYVEEDEYYQPCCEGDIVDEYDDGCVDMCLEDCHDAYEKCLNECEELCNEEDYVLELLDGD